MERFKDLSQLYKGCDIVKIGECGKLEFSEFLVASPDDENYIFAFDYATKNANKLYVPLMKLEEYYVGKCDLAFIRNKRIEALESEIKRLQINISMLKYEKGLL